MSKSIKVSEPVYQKLVKLQRPRETFSEQVERLLTIFEKMGELVGIIEGGIKYEEWKAGQLKRLKETHG